MVVLDDDDDDEAMERAEEEEEKGKTHRVEEADVVVVETEAAPAAPAPVEANLFL